MLVFAEEEKPENSEALVTNERTARQTNSTQNNQYIVRTGNGNKFVTP